MAWSVVVRQAASRRARRTASRSANPASAAAWTASAPARAGVFLGAPAGVGRVGGGDERVGGLADGPQRGVQVGLAAELGQQRLAVPGGALAGLGGLAERGLALLASLGQALLGGGDGQVEGLERALEVAVPGRGGGQLGRFGRQGARGDLQPTHLGLQRG